MAEESIMVLLSSRRYPTLWLIMAAVTLLVPTHAIAELHGRLPATPGGTDYRAYYDDVTNLTWLKDMNIPHTLQNNHLFWSDALNYGFGLSIGGVTGWRLPNIDVNGDGVIVQCGPFFPNVTLEACKDNEFEAMIVSNSFWMNGVFDENGNGRIDEGEIIGDMGPFEHPSPIGDFWAQNEGETDDFDNLYGMYYSPPQVDPEIAPFSYVSTINRKLSDFSNNVGSWYVRQGDVLGEVCNNGIDDDGDGLIDTEDPDCIPPLVRCFHDPVYLANGGELVTISAEAIDRSGTAIDVDEIEIWLDTSPVSPSLVETSTAGAVLEVSPQQTFSYGCLARNGARTDFSGWRTVVVGDFDFPALPIQYNGPLNEKIDVVFLADPDEYASTSDPDFLEDVGLLIAEGYFTIPSFVESQDSFNFWIAKDFGNTGPDPAEPDPPSAFCLREGPEDWSTTYAFADVGGLVHRSRCRDRASASLRLFTSEVDLNRLQVVAHESGHAPFGFADEYCCNTRYYSNPPSPNLLETESECTDEAADRGFDPTQCRLLESTTNDTSAWIFEPDYRALSPETRDLMQLSGCATAVGASTCSIPLDADMVGADANPNGFVECTARMTLYLGNPDGTPDNGDERYWLCHSPGPAAEALWQEFGGNIDRTEIGPSELDRFYWFLGQCSGGNC